MMNSFWEGPTRPPQPPSKPNGERPLTDRERKFIDAFFKMFAGYRVLFNRIMPASNGRFGEDAFCTLKCPCREKNQLLPCAAYSFTGPEPISDYEFNLKKCCELILKKYMEAADDE